MICDGAISDELKVKVLSGEVKPEDLRLHFDSLEISVKQNKFGGYLINVATMLGGKRMCEFSSKYAITPGDQLVLQGINGYTEMTIE